MKMKFFTMSPKGYTFIDSKSQVCTIGHTTGSALPSICLGAKGITIELSSEHLANLMPVLQDYIDKGGLFVSDDIMVLTPVIPDEILESYLMDTPYTLKQLRTHTKDKPLVYYRWCMYKIIRANSTLTLKQTGALFGHSYSTVINGINTINKYIEDDVRAIYESLVNA